MKNKFGRYKIIDNNKNVLYELNAKEFSVKLLFIISMLMELLIVCLFLIKNDIPKAMISKFKNL